MRWPVFVLLMLIPIAGFVVIEFMQFDPAPVGLGEDKIFEYMKEGLLSLRNNLMTFAIAELALLIAGVMGLKDAVAMNLAERQWAFLGCGYAVMVILFGLQLESNLTEYVNHGGFPSAQARMLVAPKLGQFACLLVSTAIIAVIAWRKANPARRQRPPSPAQPSPPPPPGPPPQE